MLTHLDSSDSRSWTLSPSPTATQLSCSLTPSPKRIPETECLAYFFTNYVNVPRENSTNIYLEHILPLYASTTAGSSLDLATTAVAINLTCMWHFDGPDCPAARLAYSRAVSALRKGIQDPNQIENDDLLASVFMLDFYDTLNRRFLGIEDTGTHQKGAIALVQRRGTASFKSEQSKRLLTCVRNRYVTYSFQKRQEVILDGGLDERIASFPSETLDLFVAELANLNHSMDRRQDYDLGNRSCTDEILTYEELAHRAMKLERKLREWPSIIPASWSPHRITNVDEIHPAIRSAGVYNDMCDVYTSLTVSHINNAYRTMYIGTCRFLLLCLSHIEPESHVHNLISRDYIYEKIQSLVDLMCASMPFHLGSRTGPTLPHEHVEYPKVPDHVRASTTYYDAFGNQVQMTDRDHIRSAAAIGGWFVLMPALAVIRAYKAKKGVFSPNASALVRLRPGQLDWIKLQLRRIREIHLLPDSFRAMDGVPPAQGVPMTRMIEGGYRHNRNFVY